MFDPMTTERIPKLRIDANQAGIYAIEESPGKWTCIRKVDGCFLARGERNEVLALFCALSRTKAL
jgi:hypothetical protein